VPLGSCARIGKITKKLYKGVPVARKRRQFIGVLRLKRRNKLRQFGIRKAEVSMMDVVVRLMQEGEYNKSTEQAF
jgi:hypothetical protein